MFKDIMLFACYMLAAVLVVALTPILMTCLVVWPLPTFAFIGVGLCYWLSTFN